MITLGFFIFDHLVSLQQDVGRDMPKKIVISCMRWGYCAVIKFEKTQVELDQFNGNIFGSGVRFLGGKLI